MRKFPPLPFGPHTRIRDLPRMMVPEESLAKVYARRHAAESWVEMIVPENRMAMETGVTKGNEYVSGRVDGKRYLSPAFEFARRQYYLMQHKGYSEVDAFAETERTFGKFDVFDRQRTDRLLQRAALAGAKLYLSPTEALGEERAVVKIMQNTAIIEDRTLKGRLKTREDLARDSALFNPMNVVAPREVEEQSPGGIKLKKGLSEKKAHPASAAKGGSKTGGKTGGKSGEKAKKK